MPLRVAGADPGTTSLDLLILEDGTVRDQCRFSPDELKTDPSLPVRWLDERGPLALIAGPSGYGLPLVRAADCTEHDLALMSLVRPDEQGSGQGVIGFSRLVRSLRDSGLPVVFLPGVIHLSTVPAHRKFNRIDLGTADKLCVAALAPAQHNVRSQFVGVPPSGGLRPNPPEGGTPTTPVYATCNCCAIELGSAFTACLVLQQGRIVDGLGGTGGPPGWRSGGAWDGETAYLLSPLSKRDLFAGGVSSLKDTAAGSAWLREGLLQAVAGLQAVTPFDRIVLSGRLLERAPELAEKIDADLSRLGQVTRLESLPGAWVKHAAQGAALIADGLAGGRYAGLVDHLQLRESAGTVLDWLHYPRCDTLRLRLSQ